MRALLLVIATSVPAVAQCGPLWSPGQGLPGTNGFVRAVHTWDPDGPGPAAPIVAFGGTFTAAGGIVVGGIATWDPATGVVGSLGAAPGQVNALASLPNGHLLAARNVPSLFGLSAYVVERWDGVAWTLLGSANGAIGALAVLPNGEIVAGGSFTSIAGVPAAGVARLSGGAWSSLAAGLSRPVHALAPLPNGDLLAAGGLLQIGGVPDYYVKRWDGTAWTQLGPSFSSDVRAVAVLPNGDVVAGGRFTDGIARWNGTAWAPLGGGSGFGAVYSLAVLPGGDLVAGGAFGSIGGVSAASIARWNGAAWSPLAGSMATTSGAGVLAVAALPNGDVVAGGGFTEVGGIAVSNLARRSGTSWSTLAPGGIVGEVLALAELPGGDLVAGGDFMVAGGGSLRNLARWNGTAWSPLGAGVSGRVRAVAVLPNGDLVAGGDFEFAGGLPVGYVARWNGLAWSPMGTGNPGLGGTVAALAQLPNGDLIAGGSFLGGVARWDGVAWSPLGGGTNGPVTSFCVRSNGTLVASGGFTAAGGVAADRVAAWDGTAWAPLGPGLPAVGLVTELAGGDLVAAYTVQIVMPIFQVSHYLARWNGVAWTTFGGINTVAASTLTPLPDGDLLVGGLFSGGLAGQSLGRWDGATWTAVGAGLDAAPKAAIVQANGDVRFGGPFSLAGGQVSARIARLSTTCPATAIAGGTGCTGGAGPVALAATALPWIGGTFRSLATGLPANAVAFRVLGFSTGAVPLASLLPQGLPGCTLYVALDLVDLVLPVAGTVPTEVPVPDALVLVGGFAHQQVVPFELDSSGGVTGITATNYLTVTIGAF